MRRQLGVWFSLVAVVTACSSSDSSGQEQFVTDYCGLLSPCCVKAGKSGDTSNCRSLLAFGTGFDKAKGDACLADLRARQNEPTFCDTAFSSTGQCKDVFQKSSSASGSKKPGEACTSDSQCAADARGTVTCTAFGRVCQVRIDGKEGDPGCFGTSYDYHGVGTATSFTGSNTDTLAEGVICDTKNGVYCDGTTLKCTKLGEVGATCAGNLECVKTAYCKSAKCADRVAIGGDCTSSFDECVDGATCNSSRKCVALLAEGSPCTTGSECASNECAKGQCVATGSGVGAAFGTALYCGN